MARKIDTPDTWCSGNDQRCGACPGCAREAFKALEEISKEDGPGLDGSPGGPCYVIAQGMLAQKR